MGAIPRLARFRHNKTHEKLQHRSHRRRRHRPGSHPRGRQGSRSRRPQVQLQAQLHPLRFRRRPLSEDRRNPARQRHRRNCASSRRSFSAPSAIPTSSPASSRTASCSPALRAGPVHQPAPGEALRTKLPAQGQGARRTSISSSSARTTTASTPARAALCSKGTPHEVAVAGHGQHPARRGPLPEVTP